MPHRRANYILSKTRSIRNLTVKGLEPELDQLMEAHQSDLVKLHAAKVAIRRRISVALDGELLQRRLILVDVVRRQHARSEYQERSRVERCMKLGDRLDGHIVQGHVDQTAQCTHIGQEQGWHTYNFEYTPSQNITVEKGSVCVNGVSLTVVNSQKNSFSVAIIPYTYEHTNFQHLEVGSTVNLEFDIIGKYITKMNA